MIGWGPIIPKLHSLKSPHQSVVGFKMIRYVSYIAHSQISIFILFSYKIAIYSILNQLVDFILILVDQNDLPDSRTYLKFYLIFISSRTVESFKSHFRKIISLWACRKIWRLKEKIPQLLIMVLIPKSANSTYYIYLFWSVNLPIRIIMIL